MARQPNDQECLLCRSVLQTGWTGAPGRHGVTAYDCPNCGRFYCQPSMLCELSDVKRAVLSHAIWRAQPKDGDGVVIDVPQIDAAKRDSLPDPAEQIDLLVFFLGKKQKSPGSSVEVAQGNLRAKFGGVRHEDELFVVDTARKEELVDDRTSDRESHLLKLTFKGWKRFRDVQRGAMHSRTAFMAMPFKEDKVKRMVDDVFRPAVEQTGFMLKRVDDEPTAGQIVNKIRVDILTSRFVIADLTGNNNGVYWEAGFAEGLSKPVIYTCEKGFFEESGTHFDIRQSLTVVWNESERERAREDIKATIRATLPFEARMCDE